MKRGLTLIELLIAILLISIISILTSTTIIESKKSSNILKNRVSRDINLQNSLNILYNDLFQSENIYLKSTENYTMAKMQGNSSIYNIPHPYIVWVVVKKNNTLLRMESSKDIELPIKENMLKYIHIDAVATNCNLFRIYMSKDSFSFLVFIGIKNLPLKFFEVKRGIAN